MDLEEDTAKRICRVVHLVSVEPDTCDSCLRREERNKRRGSRKRKVVSSNNKMEKASKLTIIR